MLTNTETRLTVRKLARVQCDFFFKNFECRCDSTAEFAIDDHEGKHLGNYCRSCCSATQTLYYIELSQVRQYAERAADATGCTVGPHDT